MVRILFSILLLFFSSSVFAANKVYDLKMDLLVNGKRVSSPRVYVKEGEIARVDEASPRSKSFIEVVASEGEIQNRKGILMNFTVGYFDKVGNKKIVSQPQVLAKENEIASIEVNNMNGKEKLKLSVLAQRKSK
jgi:ribosomal protein S4